MYCLVSTFNKTFDELGLLYFVPSFLEGKLKTWQIVEIPFWNKIEIALVLELWDLEKLNASNIPEEKIKSVISIKNENIFLNSNQIKLVKFLSSYYITPIHHCLSLFFPKNLVTNINKDKLEINDKDDIVYGFLFDKILSEKQNIVFEEINKDYKKTDNNRFLLHWTTGSWKTEIYIKLIKNQLDLGKQSLLLIPEIVLTNQLEFRIKEVFWKDVLTINSSITDLSKTKAWISIYNWDSKIIIWTRSALFYPYNNLGLVIIDEEHDSSYISDVSPRYNSIKVARKITELNWNKMLLASGTPSVISMYKALKGEYKLLKLFEKWK